MGKQRKFRVGDNVEFAFAGSPTYGEIVDIKIIAEEIRYSIVGDDGTIYPVSENKIKRKI